MSSSSSLKRPLIGVHLGSSTPRTSGVKALVKANQNSKTTLYFFANRGVDVDNKEITGIWYNESKNCWEEKKFPFPDVVYVRGGSGTETEETTQKLAELGIKRINPIIAFNKSDLYDVLSKNSTVREYLPYTRDLHNVTHLKTILQQRKSVYIKACRGRRGLQVMQVRQLDSEKYQYSYSTLGRLVRKTVHGSDALRAAIRMFFGDKPVIVQEAIDLLTINGTCPVDFRAELQRNKSGNLEIVAIPIRVGRKNSPITTHGSAYRYDAFIRKLLPSLSTQALQQKKREIHTFLRNIYRSVERAYGPFGEIGIDFALDKKGRIWLIECNAQSAKVSIRRAYGPAIVQRVYRNPLEYAKTLAQNV